MDILLKDNRLNNLMSLSRQAYGKYKFQIFFLTILSFLTAILEGIGVNALIPLFSFALKTDGTNQDVITRFIGQFFALINIRLSVASLLIFIITLFIAKALITIYLTYTRSNITTDYERQTKNDLFSKVLKADWPHLIKQKLGYLETVIMVDVPASGSLLNELSTSIQMIIGLSIYLLIAINISLPITIITLILGGILMLILKPIIYKTKILSYRLTELYKDISHHVGENILGVKSIKTMLATDGVINDGQELFNRFKKISLHRNLLKSYINAFVMPVAIIFICFIFAFSYESDTFNFASLVAIVYLIQKIFTYIQQIQNDLHNINTQLPHLRSVLNFEQAAAEHKEKNQGTTAFKFNSHLEFRNLNFSYASQEILKNINFKINKGELVGLIGPSGGGKTTMVDLILRLLTPVSGHIFLDDKEISNINLNYWWKNIGYVSQDIFLINGTIADNIRFYDKSLTQKDIERAAGMANIIDFVKSTKDKFNTNVGERGLLLSAGQRQRIVIARVLARNPELLILDEATSALDNESEIRIQEVIQKLKGKITVLIIAHRLSTIEHADKLIALDNGQIIEQGRPRELLAKRDSYFYKVYHLSGN